MKFSSLFSFYDKNLDKFLLLLRKDVTCHEYIDSWRYLTENHYQQRKKFSVGKTIKKRQVVYVGMCNEWGTRLL